MSANQYPANRLSQIITRLPSPARRKYRSLTAMIDDQRAVLAASDGRRKDYENAAARLVQRLARLDPQTAADDIADAEEELDGLRGELAQLAADRAARASVMNNVEQTVIAVQTWLQAVENGAVRIEGSLRAVTLPPLPATVDVERDLTRVRQQIAALKVEAARIAAAPLPATDIKAAITARVDQLAGQGAPQLRLDSGKVDLHFADDVALGGVLAAPPGSATAMLCWLFGDQIVAALTAGIDDAVGDRGISIADRDARRADLEARMLDRERTEEALVEHALARGLECHRRRDASPLAVLGIEVGPEQIEPALAAAVG